MGLIKAAIKSVGGVFADQWKEYFTCDALSSDELVKKGEKHNSKRSVNTKGSDNVISNGSGIVVADGQCMMIVDSGKIVEFSAEPGEYTYDSSSEPSIFYGGFGKGLLDSFKAMGRRIGYGADEARDQRVYYFNTKEILDNKFGTPNPVPFRLVDKRIDLDIDVSVRCAGVYSYRISDPMKFYKSIAGNLSGTFYRSSLDSQLKSEFISSLQPAFGRLSQMGMRPNEIVTHTTELEEALNNVLSDKWGENRGLEVATVAIATLTIPEEDQELIKNAQMSVVYSDASRAAGLFVSSQAEAMKKAAENKNGAYAGFMGMNMAGGADTSSLFKMAQEKKGKEESGDFWTCSCGAKNKGKFCTECGAQRRNLSSWVCSCGAVNTGKFCSECGKKRPEAKKCPSCGWSAKEGENPKFCPECGQKLE